MEFSFETKRNILIEILLYLICFSIFVVLQSVCIVGVNECFKGSAIKDDISGKIQYQGMIFYMIAPKFFEKYKHRDLSKPFYSCVKCMASVWGALTFWPLVIFIFGFRWIEVLVFVYDVFLLVFLNGFIYKKV